MLTTGTVRVLLVDDHELVRMAMRTVLESEPDIEVVGEAADGRSAVESACDTEPDVVLLDMRMPEMDGIDACKQIRERLPGTHVLFVSSFYDEREIDGAVSAGASGYVLKDTAPAMLVHTVRDVAGGRFVFDQSVIMTALERPSRSQRPDDIVSGRELEVLTLMAEGLKNNQIAQRLWVSEPTVKTHVSHIIRKLGQKDRTQAVLEAIRLGLVAAPGDSA